MKRNTLFRIVIIALIGLFFTISTGTIFAQNSTKCKLVEGIGNASKERILNQINTSAAGSEYTISKRKKLIINKVKSIHFEGCKAIVIADVKLKRKIRRNANGTVRITAIVDKYTKKQVCLKNPKLDKIRLSNTLRVGEGFYKWVANKVLPNNVCYSL